MHPVIRDLNIICQRYNPEIKIIPTIDADRYIMTTPYVYPNGAKIGLLIRKEGDYYGKCVQSKQS